MGDRVLRRLHREVSGEGVAKTEARADRRARAGRAEHPHLREADVRRHRDDGPKRMVLRKAGVLEGKELGEERVDLGLVAAAERGRGDRIGAGRAPEPVIDPARVERLEATEDLDDRERRVVRDHDPAGADADALGRGGDGGDEHLRRGRGDARHVVMLGDPVALEAEAIGGARELDRAADGLARRHVRADGTKIEHRESKCGHAPSLGRVTRPGKACRAAPARARSLCPSSRTSRRSSRTDT